MRIYLDNCCFNRPFDDQSQFRIKLESEAKLKIQEEIIKGHFQLVWSYILEFEVTMNPYEERRLQIRDWKRVATICIRESERLLEQAEEFAKHKIRTKDSLHLASALAGQAQYFLTTDDKLLNKDSFIHGLKIIDPLNFIREVELS